MKYSSPRIVQSGSRRIYLWLVLPVLLAGFFAWGGFDFGREQAVADLSALEAQAQRWEERIQELDAERSRLRSQVAALERASQIDREATKLAQEELKQSQDRQLKLQQELTILRGIVSGGAKEEGIYIQGFRLERSGEKSEFKYRFTVSQALKSDKVAEGWILVSLQGEQAGEEKRYSLQELTEEKTDKLKMRFRHFQDVEGVFRVPEGFEPHNVIVEIKPTTKKLPAVEKRFDWLLAG